MSRPLGEADLIFSTGHNNINAIISELKRSKLSIGNRLRSIAQDAAFVEQVASKLNLPLVANERCGSWYIDPANKAGSAYFKSTDGHHGQWSFSLRRLNLHLLQLVRDMKGCVIVDSTRRGKSMPDALSKTIPIWICIVNRLLFPQAIDSHTLFTPSTVVSASEHSQIEARIPEFLADVLTLALNLEELKSAVQRPLMPYWVTPDSAITSADLDSTQSWPIVLCTASSRVSADISNDSAYVQGAADDHEAWAHSLTPVIFWQHKAELLDTTEDDLPAAITAVVMEARQQTAAQQVCLVKPTTNLSITNNDSLIQSSHGTSAVVYCSPEPDEQLETKLKEQKTLCVRLACTEGKNGSRQLRAELSRLESIAATISAGGQIICSCQNGKDLAVGVALALLCKHYNSDGQLQQSEPSISKAIIKQKLSWIMVSMPDAAPSRATLQSVNAYLMS